jgi:hypothetical protein
VGLLLAGIFFSGEGNSIDCDDLKNSRVKEFVKVSSGGGGGRQPSGERQLRLRNDLHR